MNILKRKIKDLNVHFRIEKSKWDLVTKKCKDLRISNSQFIRYCIDILLNKRAENELKITKSQIDSWVYAQMLNKDQIILTSRQLRKIGVNLNQASKALNRIAKFSSLSNTEKNDILMQSELIYTFYTDIQNKYKYLQTLLKKTQEVN